MFKMPAEYMFRGIPNFEPGADFLKLVLQEMDNIRQELARQGQAMMMSQMKMGSAEEAEDMRNLPSALALSLRIANEVMGYSRKDLRKIAMDIKVGVPSAKGAFHFVYSKIAGWT